MNDTNNDSPSLTPWHWGWSAGLALIVLVTLAFRYALPVRDGDLWWHLLYGQYFLEHKTLIADHTIFSWTPAANDTIYCTWLPDIFLYLLHKSAGLPGIFTFRYLCMLVPVLGCFLFARQLKIATHPLTWLLCLLAVIMSYTAAFAKPEIVTYVFMTLLVWNWWYIRATSATSWRYCYLIPLIMLVWVNSHGGFVFGAVFLILIGLGELLNTWLSPKNVLPSHVRKHLFIALLLAACASLLTPYGFRYPLQLFFELLPTEANSSYNQKVTAYVSPLMDAADPFMLTLAANMVIALLLALYLLNIKRTEWSSLLSNLVFALLYTRFYRTTFYWVPVFLFSALHLLAITPQIPQSWRYATAARRILPLLVCIPALLLAGRSLYKAFLFPEPRLWLGFGIGNSNPVAEAEYIKKYFSTARIGNTYDQGAYILWRLWPENTVFFDSRHFPFRSWSDQFFSFCSGNNTNAFLDQYKCDIWCIGINQGPLLLSLLQSGNWRPAFYGRNAIILVRQDIPLSKNMPSVSTDIASHNSLSDAIESLIFSCSIMDLPTAHAILAAIQKKFSLPPHSTAVDLAQKLYAGTLAYSKGNFPEAIEYFLALNEPPAHVSFMLSSSYHQLCATAWRQKNVAIALNYAIKAWKQAPESPHALFNLGAILWYQAHLADVVDEKRPDHKKFLSQFLVVTQGKTDFDPFRPIASAMLAGEHKARPPILIPPLSIFPKGGEI